MMTSKKPSKQRKAMYQAPLHRRQKMVAAHLSKELRKQWNRRALPVRKGDEVRVMIGKFRGTIGKITKIDLKKLKVYVDNVKRKKVSGEEVHVPVHPSNLLILNPVMEDKYRKAIIDRSMKAK